MNQSEEIQVEEIWNRNIAHATKLTGRVFRDKSLIVEALTAAHRSREEEYEDEGNRNLAPEGITALQVCIRYAKSKKGKHFESKASLTLVFAITLLNSVSKCQSNLAETQ